MPFIELTRYPSGRMLINTDNIFSIYIGIRRYEQSANYVPVTVIYSEVVETIDEYVPVTVIQGTTSYNYSEVVETIDEIVSLLKAQEEKK